MMPMSMRAYNGLVGFLLTDEDRQKFEWSIGCMLDGGPCKTVVILGRTGSGKSTLMNLVRKILLSPFVGSFGPQVEFLNAADRAKINPDIFTFMEANAHTGAEPDAIVIYTTGNRVPVNKHWVLMQEVDSELVDVANHCITLYRELGEGFYNTFQENNR